MSVTEKLMSAGSWSLKFLDTVPPSILQTMDTSTAGFGLIVITPAYNPTGDSASQTAAALLSICRYAGVHRKLDERTISGAGLAVLLGDEAGKGPQMTTLSGSATAVSIASWFGTIVMAASTNGVTVGTITATSTNNVAGYYQYVALRKLIASVCNSAAAEWEVRPNASGALKLNAGIPANVFPNYTTPAAIVARRTAGSTDPTGALFGITGRLGAANDVEDITSKTYVIAQADGGGVVGSGTNGSWPYIGLDGNAIAMEQVATATDVTRGNEATTAAAIQADSSSVRREIRLAADVYDIAGEIRVGDRIWVYDQILGLYDVTTTSIIYLGEQLPALAVRAVGMTWPVRQGMGVYFLPPTGSSPTPVDLTPYIDFEEGTATVEIGALSRTLASQPLAGQGNPTGDLPRAVAIDQWVDVSASTTLTNITLGAGGILSARYKRIGTEVQFKGYISFGTGGAPTGVFSVSLPVNAYNVGNDYWAIGIAKAEDSSAVFVRSIGVAEIAPAVFGQVVHFASNGNANWDASTPIVFAVGDGIHWNITYEAATA